MIEQNNVGARAIRGARPGSLNIGENGAKTVLPLRKKIEKIFLPSGEIKIIRKVMEVSTARKWGARAALDSPLLL